MKEEIKARIEKLKEDLEYREGYIDDAARKLRFLEDLYEALYD